MMRDPLELISAYFDDSLADGEFAQLRQWIHADAEHMRQFVRESMLHSRLSDLLHEREVCSLFAEESDERDLIDPNHIVSLLEEEEAAAERRAREAEDAARREADAAARRRELDLDRKSLRLEPQQISAWWYVAAGVAASLLFVLGWQAISGPSVIEGPPPIVQRQAPAPAFVGVISRTLAARWQDPQLTVDKGAQLAAGPVSLAEGVAEIELINGARLVIEAPASLDLLSADRVQFHYGRLVANVPPQAVGFTLRSKAASFVDLGTEFGVEIAETGVAGIHVLDGEVALVRGDREAAEPSRTLQVGDANQVSADGVTVESIPFDATRFLRRVPSSAYELAVLRSRPLAYWRLDHWEEGAPMVSEGRLALPLTVPPGIVPSDNRSPEGIDGGPASAARFNGEHDGIEVTADAALGSVSNWTCEAWVLPGEGAAAPRRIFSTFDRPRSGLAIGVVDGPWHNLPDNERKFQLTVYGLYDCVSATPIPADQWVHLAATIDAAGVPALYVNGAPVERRFRHLAMEAEGDQGVVTWRAEGPTPVGNPNAGLARIGRNPVGSDGQVSPECWQGQISNVAVYDRVLSAEEIKEHVNATRTSLVESPARGEK